MKKSVLEKYNRVLTSNSSNVKYLNLKSINNFILHYNELVTFQMKNQVEELLEDYLDFLLEKGEVSQSEAKSVFYKYIQPIGDIYVKRVGFSFYTKPSTIAFFLVLFWLLFFAISAPLVLYIVTGIFSLYFFLSDFNKLKRNKVYGFDF